MTVIYVKKITLFFKVIYNEVKVKYNNEREIMLIKQIFFKIMEELTMLVSAKEMLDKAKAGHYAVGQFNINNLEWKSCFVDSTGVKILLS